MGLPVLNTYTESYARVATSDAQIEQAAIATLRSYCGRCRIVLSPTRAADPSLRRLGVPPERIARRSVGVDPERFSPAYYDSDILPDAFNVVYVGPPGNEHGIDLLAEAFLVARDRDSRHHLALAGAAAGPEARLLRTRLGSAATPLGPVDDERLARLYASADLFVFPSTSDTVAQAILEAQASGPAARGFGILTLLVDLLAQCGFKAADTSGRRRMMPT